jgi:hypothetical protein
MLASGASIFVQPAEEAADRILHPATIVDRTEHVIAELQEPLDLEAGQDLLVFYEVRREFMKQPVRVEVTMEGDAGRRLVGFVPVSDPVSAESRQFHRVSTVTGGLEANFGSEDHCPVTDVSIKGFSVISGRDHNIGDHVPTTIHHLEQHIRGTGLVQSIKGMGDGRTRYGLLCTKQRGRVNELDSGLQRMTMLLQRQQLKRRARG